LQRYIASKAAGLYLKSPKIKIESKQKVHQIAAMKTIKNLKSLIIMMMKTQIKKEKKNRKSKLAI
jgi:hypothetical protein